MSTPAHLLARTDQLARDLLADPDTSVGVDPYRNWHDMIHQAAEAWRAADQSPRASLGQDPFLGIQSMINNAVQPGALSSGGTDARVTALTIQLGRLTNHYRFEPKNRARSSTARAQRVQGSILHAGYLVTHAAGLALRRELAATKKPDLLAEIGRARETVGIAEQILDVHLHYKPARSVADQQLDIALTRWTATAHQVLSEQPPEPKNNYIISDVQHGLLAHTAASLQTAAQPGLAGDDRLAEQRERLLPALVRSTDHWRQVRQAWAGLAAPTTGISRELADAARLLNQTLRDPELDRSGHAGHLIASTLSAAVNIARGLADAFDSDRLRAPTDVVVRLTQSALDRLPDTNPYQVWMGIARHEGRAPIALPVPLREELTRNGLRNVEAAKTLRSASYSLLDTSTRISPTVHRVRSPGVQAADRAVANRSRDTVGPRR